MPVSVFPEKMGSIDPKDVDTSLRTLETYIHYICERTEFALTNTFRTTNGLGDSAEVLSIILEKNVSDLHALEGDVGHFLEYLNTKVDKVPGKDLSANDYTDEEKLKLAGIEDGAQVNDVSVGDIAEINSKISQIETILMNAGPIIYEDPVSVTKEAGSAVTFCVKAIGTELTYQWEYSSDSGTSWTSWGPDATEDSLTIDASVDLNGFLFRCKVTGNGKTYSSGAAQLTVT